MINRRFLAGVDGGGTKTACLVSDFEGKHISAGYTGGSNHQISGLPIAIDHVRESIDIACNRAGITINQLAFVYLGMAGADLPCDFRMLNEALLHVLGDVPFILVNDSRIAFLSEAETDWGAISVCGTGNNMAVWDRDGRTHSVRALRYMLGNYGGGNHLAEMALHYAFRCDEGTGPATQLAEALPGFCGCDSMEQLAKQIYDSDYRYQKNFNIPKLVFDLAREGDSISFHLVQKMGSVLGEMLGRMIVNVGLSEEEVPVVLSGSQYEKDNYGFFCRPMIERLHTFVPKAVVKVTQSPPVYGALISSFSKMGITLPTEVKASIRAKAELIIEAS